MHMKMKSSKRVLAEGVSAKGREESMTEERKEIYIVWMCEWRAYRIYLPEHPQKSLGYSVDLRVLQEEAKKRFADREIRVFSDDSGEEITPYDPAYKEDTIWRFVCIGAFLAGIAFAAWLGWLSSI